MLTNDLKHYFFTEIPLPSEQNQQINQLSTLRTLTAFCLCISIITGLHSIAALDEPLSNFLLLTVNGVYTSSLIALLLLSSRYPKKAPILLPSFVATFCGGLLMVDSDQFEQMPLLITLHLLPIIMVLLFNAKIALCAIAFNTAFLISLLIANTNALTTMPFHFEPLPFIILNIALPLTVIRILFLLKKKTQHINTLNQKIRNKVNLCDELFERSGAPSLLCDKQSKLIKANKLARQLLFKDVKHSFTGTHLDDWLSPLPAEDNIHWHDNAAQCLIKNEENTHLKVSKIPLNEYQYDILHLHNVTQLRAIKLELENTQQINERLSNFDLLTKLSNTKHFCDQVNHAIKEGEAHLTGAMFIIRICQFKLLNKEYGKHAANTILLNFSKALQQNLSDQAISGRLRGIKFACFIPLSQIHLIQKNLMALIHSILPAQLPLEEHSLNMEYQVGIAYYGADGDNADSLLENCEMALEHSSHINRYSFYNHQREEKLVQEHTLGLKLDSAISNNKIELWLQPQISQNGKIVSFEALARWKDAGKFIPPATFIQVAEDLGLLAKLAENLIRRLIISLEDFRKRNIHIPVAFNLAGQELMNDAFFAFLVTKATEHAWLTKMLKLEITETSKVITHPQVHKRSKILVKYGFSIAIDDFGTGQASLGQLIDIPANTLKIDKRFVEPLPHDQKHLDIVKSTIQLAKSLNMTVIAEGIENQQQADLLFNLGCHLLQGFHFSKPQPIEDWIDNKKPYQSIAL